MFDRIDKGMWWDKSWNPVRLKEGYGFGCTKVSPGCANCWAERYSRRFFKTPPYDNRKREFMLNERVLTEPLRARKPRVYFVCDLMDLFHKDVPFDFIEAVWATMMEADNHIYIILTKRPKRMLEVAKYFCWTDVPQVWLGVSVEDQKTADERIPILLRVPAAVRVVSIEPMLGPVNILRELMFIPEIGINWVICGGETGPRARPMNPEWVHELRNQCIQARVSFFFKSWGDLHYNFDTTTTPLWNYMFRNRGWTRAKSKMHERRLLDGREWNQVPGMSHD